MEKTPKKRFWLRKQTQKICSIVLLSVIIAVLLLPNLKKSSMARIVERKTIVVNVGFATIAGLSDQTGTVTLDLSKDNRRIRLMSCYCGLIRCSIDAPVNVTGILAPISPTAASVGDIIGGSLGSEILITNSQATFKDGITINSRENLTISLTAHFAANVTTDDDISMGAILEFELY